MSKSTTPNLETAISGFQQMIEVMKTQKSSWTNYLTVQNSGDFVPFRILESAFFMQAICNKEHYIKYNDRFSVEIADICSLLDKDKYTLLYEKDLSGYKEFLYMCGGNTILLIEESLYSDFSNVEVSVLTFDRSLLEDQIKPMLNKFKEKNV